MFTVNIEAVFAAVAVREKATGLGNCWEIPGEMFVEDFERLLFEMRKMT